VRPALLALLLAAMALAGCANDPTVPLSSWALESPATSEASRVELPAHFDGRLPREACHYVLRTRVAVPEPWRGADLTLAIPHFLALASLRIDGRLIDPLDVDDVARYRGSASYRWRVPSDLTARGELDLALDVDHTWTQSAWLDTVPRLSATPRGDRAFRWIAAFDRVTASAALTTLLMAAFVYGVVFLLDRRQRAYGWFALHAMGAAYPAFQLGFPQVAIGSWDVAAMATLVVFGNVSAVHFTHAKFALGRPSRAWTGACVVAVAMLPFAHGPFMATRTFGTLAMFATISNVVYQIVFFTLRFARQRSVPLHTLAIFSSWTVLGLLAIPDFGWWLGLGEVAGGWHGASLGIASLALLQSAALAHEHGRSLRTAQDLNVELRRQIAARSQQLSELLARDANAAPASPAIAPGDTIAGRYQVVRSIGAGGMGSVYEVRRTSDGRRLALKVLHGHASGDAMARFAREAQLASQIDHPHIVGVVDVDVTAEGTLFLVMDYVDGPSLESERARFGDASWARPLLGQIAAALAAIHAKGIVHRDLKPANVLLADGTRAMIADFGISTLTYEAIEGALESAPTLTPQAARALPGADAALTRTGIIMGTPRYMAPEMFRSARNAKPAADVFSFGVIACEMLSGRDPLAEGPTAAAPRARGGSERPRAVLASLCPDLDPRLTSLVDRCMQRDPAERPSAEELVRALDGRT
jgi:serine/threonine-protein kinase